MGESTERTVLRSCVEYRMAQVLIQGREISVKYYYKQYATKACTNKDHVNLRNVVGKARQSLLTGVSHLNASY